MRYEFTAIIKKTPKWYVGFCLEVPGANGQGKTRADCLEDLRAAVELLLEVNREQLESTVTGKVENPRSPQYPVTTVQLNREHELVKEVLGAAASANGASASDAASDGEPPEQDSEPG